MPEYLADCYLCPGNLRVSGARNDNYWGTFVFDNDHPSVGFDAPQTLKVPPGIYRNQPARGIARVVCYSPNHSLALAELEPWEIANLLGVWQEQYRDLGGRNEIKHVLIFENKGEAVRVSTRTSLSDLCNQLCLQDHRDGSARANAIWQKLDAFFFRT